MEWGILFVLFLLIFISYVVIQETRAQMHWRGLVEHGDVPAIKELVENEIETWHNSRVPRGTSSLLWHGVQTVSLIEVNAEGIRVSANADGEYALVDGQRIETSSPLSEGMKVTMKLAEMILYDIPNVKLDRAQIDVYTSFRDASGRAEPRCILSSRVERADVEHIDWEQTTPGEFVAEVEGRFAAGNDGNVRPIDPLPWDNAMTKGA